ncbi:hypothetical protein HDV03_002793 [Kappamyces sp. JEL0829]|nr:hypothetical protein HDV03_002793 [Kappamyces sp. JEL0829]KAJ3348590.1 hypothetical protein HDU91_006541 [Kappamyces sp. JEL0680]
MHQHLDFASLHMNTGPVALPAVEQTPNSFLTSLPKLSMEVNQFERSFKHPQQEVSPNNPMDSLQQMHERQPTPFNVSELQSPQVDLSPYHVDTSMMIHRQMTPLSPDAYTLASPMTMPSSSPQPNQLQQMSWNAKRRPSFLAEPFSHSEHRFDASVPFMNPVKRSMSLVGEIDPMFEMNKRGRSNSITSMASEGSNNDESQRLSFLERNRKAAMKCRLKKKNYLAGLEQKVEQLSKENKSLLEEIARLKQLVGEASSL